VRSGWDEVDRLHEAFAQSVTQILTYKNVPEQQSAAELQWGKTTDSTFKRDECDELHDLLMLLIRTTNGISLGCRTITHERDTLQSKPFDSLKEAWPQFIYVDDVHDNSEKTETDTDKETYRLDDYTYVKSADVLVNATADIVNRSFVALDVKPSIFYNFLFSVVSAANISVAPCQYESVQTCSQWRVRLLHGILICLFFFTVFAWVLNIFGFSFLIALLVPLFSIVIFQLCYGYTFRCLPMMPTCAFQDFTESINMLLPLSLELPDDLKSTDAKCLVKCGSENNQSILDHSTASCLARYPSVKCTRSCKDAPFSYTSSLSVITWVLAEI
jgi:hypothetical protein